MSLSIYDVQHNRNKFITITIYDDDVATFFINFFFYINSIIFHAISFDSRNGEKERQ